jgi:transposase
MSNVPVGARILLATQPIDFRKGAQSLAALAREALGENPFSGTVIVYRSKRSDRPKLLVWDTSGLVLVPKQTHQGSIAWPPIMDGVMKLSQVEFSAVFGGLDWTRVQTRKKFPNPTVAS